MTKRWLGVSALAMTLILLAGSVHAAEEYAVDAAHAGINFKISHLGLSWVYGRFNNFSGGFSLDPSDGSKNSFNMEIKVDSIDTGNKMRDGHLLNADFFNAKDHPIMTFKSTNVKPIKDGYQVTGDFTMLGVTKPVSFTLVGGRKAEFPKGVSRTGFTTDFTIKRSEFGMTKFTDMIGDDVQVSISFEGTKK
jgi:polyisoprenoid-binding protein YceI